MQDNCRPRKSATWFVHLWFNVHIEKICVKGILLRLAVRNICRKVAIKKKKEEMPGKIYALFAGFVQLRLSHSYTTFVSGVISEDVTFIHKTFSVPPSMRAIIQVYVFYPSILPSHGITAHGKWLKAAKVPSCVVHNNTLS